MEKHNKLIFPMRINRYLARLGHGTRRSIDELVKKGAVTINGRTAVLGDTVTEKDKVEITSKKGASTQYVYLAYNKPRDIITHSPQSGEQGIEDVLDYHKRVFPIGRLDKSSRGLIILTNDGRITDRLLNPDHIHEKEYVMLVDKPITPAHIKALASGVNIEGYRTAKATVRRSGDRQIHITITEGKKHQLRRMAQAVGLKTLDLKRIRIMNVTLGKTSEGGYREVKGTELYTFLKKLGLKE